MCIDTLPRQPFDDQNDVGIFTARRHEIDQADGAALGFDFGFQNQRVVTVSAPGFLGFFLGEKPPARFPLPSSEAKHAGESNRGRQSQSTHPSRLTKAPVCVSLRNA